MTAPVPTEMPPERLIVGHHYMTPGGSVFRLCEQPGPYLGVGYQPWIWAYPNEMRPTITDGYVTRPLRQVYFKQVDA